MSALEDNSEQPAAPAGEQPFDVKRKWYFNFLETCRTLAGLPVLVSLILEAVTPNTRVVGIGTIIAFAVALLLRFFPKLGRTFKPRSARALWTALPWFLTVALAVVLVFFILPRRAVEQDSLLANSWLQWQKALEEASGQCNNATGQDKCLAEKLAPVISRRPRPMRSGDVTGLASDLMAGQLLLANDKVRSVLGAKLSIDDRFLGTGLSEPVGQTDFTAARAAEYLVPNLSDRSPHVWLWEVEYTANRNQKPVVEQNLVEVLHAVVPANHADFEENWAWLQQHLMPNDPEPVLVRFALLDTKKVHYSGCLGRPNATRVFMSNLGELMSRPVREAADSTGYVVPKKSDEPGLNLFIWVYAPTASNEVVRATWASVLANLAGWITAEPCQSRD